jgi:hypothetical protein
LYSRLLFNTNKNDLAVTQGNILRQLQHTPRKEKACSSGYYQHWARGEVDDPVADGFVFPAFG